MHQSNIYDLKLYSRWTDCPPWSRGERGLRLKFLLNSIIVWLVQTCQ